jgi:hypothetical protein
MRRLLASLTAAVIFTLVTVLPARSQWFIGPNNWVMLLCQFSDTAAEPHPASYFETLMSPVGGIGLWWNTMSYGGTFSPQIIGWLTVPNAKAHYTTMTVEAMRDALYQDCRAQAAPLIPSGTMGVIVVAAEPMAAGFAGARDDTGTGAVAWLSPTEYIIPMRTIHYIAAAMGVRYSLIDSATVMPNPWDGSSGSLALCLPTTDCYPPHPAAYAKLLAGLIPTQRLGIHSSAGSSDYPVDFLDSPASAGVHAVAVPLSTANAYEFYLIEARRNSGSNYDQILPGSGVLIHRINEAAPRYQAWLVGASDVNSAVSSSAIWTPGETFVDAVNGIQISVMRQTASGYDVRVTRGQIATPVPTATAVPTAVPTPVITPLPPDNLLVNPSFEGFDIEGRPWGWHYRGSDNSRVVCGVATEGVCALQLRREGQLHSFFATNLFAPGERLSFGADIYNNSPEGNIQLVLIVKYADPNLPKDQLLLVPAGSYRQFRRYSGTLTLVGAPSSMQLAIRTAGLAGRVYVDNVYLRRGSP